MVGKIKEYWFGILLLIGAVLFLLFVALVAAAPHDDAQMRGFTPCTYEMAEELSLQGGQKKIWGVLGAVTDSYFCYAGVVWSGVGLWLDGKQPTPWTNYLFASENFKVPAGMSEPFSKDLIKANRLDDAEDSATIWERNNKEK